jgi:hypothetical protein
MPFRAEHFRPTSINRFIKNLPTGASVVVVQTDSGPAYLKGLGNESGPHALACELVGSLAAHWLGLPTLDFAIVQVTDLDELPLFKGGQVEPGPAFVSAQVQGYAWGGDDASLSRVVNQPDLTRLMILDTWILNCDRYSVTNGKIRQNRDNVFFMKEDASTHQRLIAIDHTHAFTCGADLSAKINTLDRIQDPQRYGVFPQFAPLWDLAAASDALTRLAGMTIGTARGFIGQIPIEWEVAELVRERWADFLTRRAHWLSAQGAADWLSNNPFSNKR